MEGGTCIVHSMGDEDRWKWGGETKDDLNTVRTGGWIYGLRNVKTILSVDAPLPDYSVPLWYGLPHGYGCRPLR